MVWQCTPQRALVPFAVSAGAQPPPVWRRRLTPPPSSHSCLPLGGGKVSRSDGRGEWGNAKANASPPLPSPRGEGGTSRLRRVTDEGRRQTQNPAPLISRLRRQLPPRGKPRQNRGRAPRPHPTFAFWLGDMYCGARTPPLPSPEGEAEATRRRTAFFQRQKAEANSKTIDLFDTVGK